MQFKKGAEVISAEGEKIGTLDRVVMDPKTREVAYLVVKSGFLLREDKLIPIDFLENITENQIRVTASKEKLDELPKYEEVHYIPADQSTEELSDADVYYWYPPAFGLHSLGQYPPYLQLVHTPRIEKNIPDNMVALKEGARVLASDDEHVGNIERIVLDESNDQVTHFVISSGIFLKERKLIPAYWLTSVSEDEVRLAVASSFLDGLPEFRSEEVIPATGDKLTAKASTTINAPASKVWEALTRPDIIKQYMFGTDVISDWKVGSPIVYKGEWQGKAFEDKGKILVFEKDRRLVSTHWSPLSGVPDTPENYHTVAYELSEQNGKTQVTITQANNASEEEKIESERNWNAMLDGLKEVLEQKS